MRGIVVVMAVCILAAAAASTFAAVQAAPEPPAGPALMQGDNLVVVAGGMIAVYRLAGGAWQLVSAVPMPGASAGDPGPRVVELQAGRPREVPGIGGRPPLGIQAPGARGPVAAPGQARVQAPPPRPAVTSPGRARVTGTQERAITPGAGARRGPAPVETGRGVFQPMAPPTLKAPPTPIGRQALERPVPRAPFQGPALGPAAPAPTPPVRRQTQERLRTWVREHNVSPPPPTAPMPTRDTVGNPIPQGAVRVTASTLSRFNPDFARITRVIGLPAHTYTFVPRTVTYPGFFTFGNGLDAYRRFRHRPVIVINLFYPYYFSDPFWFAFNYPGYYPSCFSLWGYTPGWIYPYRGYFEPYESFYTPPEYSYDRQGLQRAVNDIRRAWLDGDITRISDHLTDRADIRIYFNGRYSYSTSTDDYYGMAADTLATTDTISMTFSSPQWVSSQEAWVNGTQVFTAPDGTRRTLYVSYRLRRLGDEWYIVGFGSSEQPERNPFALYQ